MNSTLPTRQTERPDRTGLSHYEIIADGLIHAAAVFGIRQDELFVERVAELIRQLDDSGFGSGGLALGYNNMNAEDSSFQELRHFTSISSSFYHTLHAHYEQVFDDWVRENFAEQDREEEE
jgi:hypothetical protein